MKVGALQVPYSKLLVLYIVQRLQGTVGRIEINTGRGKIDQEGKIKEGGEKIGKIKTGWVYTPLVLPSETNSPL